MFVWLRTIIDLDWPIMNDQNTMRIDLHHWFLNKKIVNDRSNIHDVRYFLHKFSSRNLFTKEYTSQEVRETRNLAGQPSLWIHFSHTVTFIRNLLPPENNTGTWNIEKWKSFFDNSRCIHLCDIFRKVS